MKVIQLRGTNATGKTTAVRQFIARGNFEVREIAVNGEMIEYHYEPARNIVVLGRYDTRVSGGIDGRIIKKSVLMNSIIKICKTIRPDVFIFEGIVYGVTFKFAYEIYKALKLLNYEYKAICLIPPLETAFDRVAERNGGKPVNLLKIQQKWFTAARSAEVLKQHGVPVKIVDTSKINKEDMWKIVQAEL